MESPTTEIRDGVALLTLDDGKVNALSPERISALEGALDALEKDEAVTAVALVGRPGRFSAGFDLKVMRGGGAERAQQMVAAGGQLYLRFLEYPLPIVVGCTGHALAAGAIALLTADHRVGAAGEFQIGLNETAIGMTLPSYGVEFARARLSKRHLDRAVVHAEIYDPEGARDAGFLDEVVAPERVLERALDLAKRLGALPQPAFRNNKRRAHAPVLERLRDSLVQDVRNLFPG